MFSVALSLQRCLEQSSRKDHNAARPSSPTELDLSSRRLPNIKTASPQISYVIAWLGKRNIRADYGKKKTSSENKTGNVVMRPKTRPNRDRSGSSWKPRSLTITESDLTSTDEYYFQVTILVGQLVVSRDNLTQVFKD